MNKAAWASFWILGLIWGSSFLLIRIGVEDISATQLVFIRVLIGAVGLTIAMYMRGKRLPTDWPMLRSFIIIGAGNVTIPYILISFAEQNITSGMAAVLQATASLFTLVIAHFAFADERMSPQKIVGLGVGFIGVIVLSSNAIDPGGGLNTPMLLGIGGMVLASLFYATFITYSRKVINRDIEPIVVAAGTFIPAAAIAFGFMLLEPLVGGRAAISIVDMPSKALMAVVGLGFFNTFIAYLFFYFIIQQLGAFRASMVTYIVPAIGLMLGVLVGETVTATMLLGATIIFAGIGIVNLRYSDLLRYVSRTARATT